MMREDVYGLLPHVKITDLLLEINRWTGYSVLRPFEDRRTSKRPNSSAHGHSCRCNKYGPCEMAESCPGTSLSKLSWLVAWHIRDEPYSKALAEIVNYQHRVLFATHWGEGTTSSSDGQRYRAGGRERVAKLSIDHFCKRS